MIHITLFIAIIQNIAAYFQIFTCAKQYRHVKYRVQFDDLKQAGFAEKYLEERRLVDLKYIKYYSTFIAFRLFLLNVGLVVFNVSQGFPHMTERTEALSFLSVILLAYSIFQLPEIWERAVRSQYYPGELRRNMPKVLLLISLFFVFKIFKKFVFLMLFVNFSNFVMDFFFACTFIVFMVKLLGAAYLKWIVNDDRFIDFSTHPSYEKICELCKSLHVSPKKLFVSRPASLQEMAYEDNEPPHKFSRFKKANAADDPLLSYVYGFFRVKHLVLDHALVSRLSEAELLAIIAHEIAHWKFEHNFYRFMYYYLQNITIFFLLRNVLLDHDIWMVFRFARDSLYSRLMIIVPMIPLYYRITDIILNYFTRIQEFNADKFAVKHGYAQPLKTAICKIYAMQTACLNPYDWYSMLNTSQGEPPLVSRLQKIENWAARQSLRSNTAS